MSDTIEFKFGTPEFSYDFKFKVGYIMYMGNSGTGKSFMFSVLNDYCRVKNIPVMYVTYKNIDVITMKDFSEHCKKSKFVIFDNGDLYLTQELLESVKSADNIVLFSTKKAFPYLHGVSLGSVMFTKDKLVTY